MPNRKYTMGHTDGHDLYVACAQCGRETNHTVMCSVRENGSEPVGDHYEVDWVDDCQVIRCLGCSKISFRQNSSNSEDYEPESDGYNWVETLYPPRSSNRPELSNAMFLPADIQPVYQETIKALNNALPIMSGIGIRAIVETVSNLKQARGANLYQKINDLVVKGILTPDGARILHNIRELGNDAAHKVKAHTPAELEVAMDVGRRQLLLPPATIIFAGLKPSSLVHHRAV
jgi:hypothetical protein